MTDTQTQPESPPTAVRPEPKPLSAAQLRRARRRRVIQIVAGVVGLIVFLAIIQRNWGTLTAVDAPFTLRTDDRLSFISPEDEADVNLPLTITWEATDFDLSDGNQFGIFVDQGFPAPDQVVRTNVCSRQAAQPPSPGELRGPCQEQRDKILFTQETSMTFFCFDAFLNRGTRRQDDHEVHVVLLDKFKRRIGETSATVRFTVDRQDSRDCRGLEREDEGVEG